MLKTELLEIIANGENSGVEFKRDDIRPEQLAKEIVALVNFQGWRILLGVEDNGAISGLQRTAWPVSTSRSNRCRSALDNIRILRLGSALSMPRPLKGDYVFISHFSMAFKY